MTNNDLLTQLNQWYEEGKHEAIAEKLQAMPTSEMNYDLISALARALNNLSRYEEAFRLLQSVSEEGQKDPYWHFRMGYSLYYIDGREVEAIPYLERAIELGDDYPSTYELLQDAKRFLDEDEDAEVEENAPDFTPQGYATLSLNMRLQPEHRHQYFEDSLDFMLRSKGLGRVSGGGTLVDPDNGEPMSCDIEIDLKEDSETMKQALLSLTKLEAAKGSVLKYRSAKNNSTPLVYDLELSLGNLEGIAVYLNGTDLPDEVYEENDINEVITTLYDLLSNNGALQYSYWDGPQDAALYFYGEGEYETMLNKITPFLKEHPLCQKCKVVHIS